MRLNTSRPILAMLLLASGCDTGQPDAPEPRSADRVGSAPATATMIGETAKGKQPSATHGGSDVQFEVVGADATEPEAEIEVADDIKRGDIVFFDRVGPKKVMMRVLPAVESNKPGIRKYRVDSGSKPGAIKLTQIDN